MTKKKIRLSRPGLSKSKTAIPLLTHEARIKRGLRRHLRSLGFSRSPTGCLLPPELTKENIRKLHQAQRIEKLLHSKDLVESRWHDLKGYFADGTEVHPESLSARLELIESNTWQSDLFRLATLTWSVPVSPGYGRRMRFLVWDKSNDKLIGVMALGDPVFNIKARDDWIGWTMEQRRQRLVHVMDAYVLGAVPPYNMLLGGKLVACLVKTSEVRSAFAAKYRHRSGTISRATRDHDLYVVTTTSALGRSSIYNRLKLRGHTVFRSIGFTSGWGHFHIPDELFSLMRDYLKDLGDPYDSNYHFGGGPNWKLRAVKRTLQRLRIATDLLRHGVTREVFACELAENARELLVGNSGEPDYSELPTAATVSLLARERWLISRFKRFPDVSQWRRDALLERLISSHSSFLQHTGLSASKWNGNGIG